MPSTYIIGRDGEIHAKHFGFKVKKQDEYEAVISEALSAGE
jgi:peroxiredoxin